MLRDGRDGLINLVDGVYQKRPNTKWLYQKWKLEAKLLRKA